ncbi:MAG: glycerate kinase [Flavobacteriaceae bacterium]|nr:glycerate kinase [Flavobacteriaceae bacterium]MCY4268367.1 glycerate kinase [Flavobacteriaceae bacterium]
MMKYLLIPDKFKSSLTSQGVIEALTNGIVQVDQNALIESIQVSDGGDGFLDSVDTSGSYQRIPVQSVNAYGDPIASYYLWDSINHSAFIELANTCGVSSIDKSRLQIMKSSTHGIGIQIRDAIEKGAKQVYVGIGGSITNDGGIGLAQELGYRFFDKNHQEITHCNASSLNLLSDISRPDNEEVFQKVAFYAVNDVENPLFGTSGAAYIYSSQKGASDEEMKQLDRGLQNLDALVIRKLGKKDSSTKGAGAAGGTAYGLKVFLDAEFIRGFDFLSQRHQLYDIIEGGHYDYIITGEGRFDSQSLNGKFVQGILKMAEVSPKSKVVIICGTSEFESLDGYQNQIMVLQIKRQELETTYCMENAAMLVENKISDFLKQS